MKPLHRAALVLAVALGAAACRSSSTGTDSVDGALDMKTKNYQVVWTRGGKLGFLKTYRVSRPGEPAVDLHYVTDLNFQERGWVADDGQGERYDYPDQKIREARRAAFERIPLPVDTLENQVRRILGVAPTTEIALRPASEADLKR